MAHHDQTRWAWLTVGAVLAAATLLKHDRKRPSKEIEHPFGAATSRDEPLSLHKQRAAEHGRGRRARYPWKIPWRGWRDILWRTYTQFNEDRLLAVAAGVVFFVLLALFPRLEERADTPGGVLSGGEQQMLTICRTLMGDPDLIMIDEPTEGLSPQMVERVGAMLTEIAARGVSVLLVEQKLTIALKISRRLYVMGRGRIVFEGTPAALIAAEGMRKEWLEV